MFYCITHSQHLLHRNAPILSRAEGLSPMPGYNLNLRKTRDGVQQETILVRHRCPMRDTHLRSRLCIRIGVSQREKIPLQVDRT